MKRAGTVVLAFALAIIWAVPAAAGEVVVRSGEHAGFSRLVIHLPARVGWTLGAKAETRTLALSRDAIDWDLSAVFDRISGDRVTSVTPLKRQPGLSFALACACDVDVFWHGASMLVVDVKDRTGDGTNRSEQIEKNTAPIGNAAFGGTNQHSRLGRQTDALPLPRRVAAQKTAVTLASRALEPGEEATRTAPRSPEAQARRAIARQVARAAGLGLVETTPGAGRRGDVDAAAPNGADDTQAANVTAHTGAERSPGLPDEAAIQTPAGTACLADDLLAVADWGTDASFAQQIGGARRDALDESASDPRAASLALARLYVHFGFGAEARQVAKRAGLRGKAATVVRAMAQVVDGKTAETAVLYGQADCPGDVALWSILATPAKVAVGPADVDAVLRALARLPRDLKTLLGARLARQFAQAGQSSAAGRVMRLVDRSAASPAPERTLANIEATAPKEDASRSEGALLSLVEGNSEAAPRALLDLIDTRVRAGDPVPPDWVDLAGSYALEQRGTEFGRALNRGYVGALAAAGRYDAAFQKLARRPPGADEEVAAGAADAVAAYTVRNADDLAFLKHLGYGPAASSMHLSSATANAVARRLIRLGFPGKAHGFLSGNAEGAAGKERRLLRAEAALARAAPREAIASLLGVEGREADSLRARAHGRLGAHEEAQALYLSAGRDDDDVLDADKAREEHAIPGQLSRADALLNESASARERVGRLLDAKGFSAPGAE